MVENKTELIIKIIKNLEDNGVFELEFIKENIFPAAYQSDMPSIKSSFVKELKKLDKKDLVSLSESTRDKEKLSMFFKVLRTVSAAQIEFYRKLLSNSGLSQSNLADSIKELKKQFEEGIAPNTGDPSNAKKVLGDILTPFKDDVKTRKIVFADENYDPEDIDLEEMFENMGDVDPEDMN